MVLKEAFAYQNYLSKLIEEAQNYLMTPDFILDKVEYHYKSKADPAAKDETKIVASSVQVEFTPIQVIDLVMDLFAEKDALAKAILDAKNSVSNISIDEAVSMNNVRRNFLRSLQYLSNKKSNETDTTATGFKIDNEGKQTAYIYDVKRVATINYDRDGVKKLIKKITKECDVVSMAIDNAFVTQSVDFVPKYDITDTLEDILEG